MNYLDVPIVKLDNQLLQKYNVLQVCIPIIIIRFFFFGTVWVYLKGMLGSPKTPVGKTKVCVFTNYIFLINFYFVISLQAKKMIAKLQKEKNVSSHLFIMETLMIVILLVNLSMVLLGVLQVQIGAEKLKLGKIVNQDVQDIMKNFGL